MARPSVKALERRRAEILEQIQTLGDMRRGSIVEQYLKCGKSPCRCKQPNHPGHGPYFTFTRKLGGKTQTRQFRPGPALAKLKREVENFHRLQALSDQLVVINEELCELRPVAATEPEVKKTSGAGSKRRSSRKSTASQSAP